MKIWHLIFWVCYVFIGVDEAFSQHLYTKTFGINDGLPDQEVIFLSTAPDGMLWVQTSRHLCRYNGYEFECWDHQQSGITHQIFSVFYVNGCSYFGTYHSGFNSIKFCDGEFSKVDSTRSYHASVFGKTIMVKNDIIFAQDPFTFIIDTLSNKLSKYGNPSKLSVSVSFKNELIITKEDKTKVYLNEFGVEVDSFAFTTIDGYHLKNQENKSVRCTHQSTQKVVNINFEGKIEYYLNRQDGSTIISIDRDGYTYFYKLDGTMLGHHKLDGAGFTTSDLYGNLWIGNHSGLTMVNPRVKHISQDNTLGMVSNLHTIQQDSKGRMLFGGFNTGLAYLEGERCDVIPISNPLDLAILPGGYTEGNNSYFFTSRKCELLQVSDIKVRNPIAAYLNENPNKLLTGYIIKRLNDGKFALGMNSTDLAIVDDLNDICNTSTIISKEKGLNLYNVLTISEDAKGRLWCGRTTTGIGLYDRLNDKAITWSRDINDTHTFGAISSLIDDKGTLWLGTNDGLKYIKDIANFDYQAHSPFDKASTYLNNNNDRSVVGSLYETDQYIVSGSVQGLTFIDKADFYSGNNRSYFLPYGPSLPGISTDQNGMMQDRDGYLWVTTDDGAVRLDPKDLPVDTFRTDIAISEIIIGDSTYNTLKGDIILPPDNRNIAINLKVIKNPALQATMSFSSYLIDSKGDTILKQENVRLSSLPRQFLSPGNYTYSIAAKKNNEVVWNKDLHIKAKASLVEMPLFWAGLVGSLLTFIMIIGYNITKRRNDNLKNKLIIQDLQNARDGAKLQAIISSFNPHFINNSLHWIQSKHVKDPQTVTIIDRLSKNIEHIFKRTREGTATHTIAEELELVDNYIKIQQIRFKDSFRYESPSEEFIAIIGNFQCVLMQIQIHVENAIEHGLSNRKSSTYVRVELRSIDDRIEIIIEDDGAGRTRAKEIGSHGTQSGVKMLEELHSIYNKINTEQMSQQYIDNINGDHGTRVIISIPQSISFDLHNNINN